MYFQKKKQPPPVKDNIFNICMIQIDYKNLRSSQSSNKVFFAAGLLAILVLSAVINPEHSEFLPCFFKEITGHSCPSCGLSRSLYAVSQLQFKEAFRFHLMGPVLYIIFLVLCLKFSIEILIKKEIGLGFNSFVVKGFFIIFAGVWLVYWIIRFFNDV